MKNRPFDSPAFPLWDLASTVEHVPIEVQNAGSQRSERFLSKMNVGKVGSVSHSVLVNPDRHSYFSWREVTKPQRIGSTISSVTSDRRITRLSILSLWESNQLQRSFPCARCLRIEWFQLNSVLLTLTHLISTMCSMVIVRGMHHSRNGWLRVNGASAWLPETLINWTITVRKWLTISVTRNQLDDRSDLFDLFFVRHIEGDVMRWLFSNSACETHSKISDRTWEGDRFFQSLAWEFIPHLDMSLFATVVPAIWLSLSMIL